MHQRKTHEADRGAQHQEDAFDDLFMRPRLQTWGSMQGMPTMAGGGGMGGGTKRPTMVSNAL